MGLLPYSLCICFLLPRIFFFFFVPLIPGITGAAGGNSPILFDLRLVSIIFWQKSHFIPLLFPRCLFPRINWRGGGWSFCRRDDAHQTTSRKLGVERAGLSPFVQMIYNSWQGCKGGVNVSGGRRNVKAPCLLAVFMCLQSREWGWWFDLHQMFHACPAVVVTTLIKDLSALMFYSSFMGQQSLNYLSALILHVYKYVCARVHNCSALLSADVHAFETAFVIQSFVIWVHFRWG